MGAWIGGQSEISKAFNRREAHTARKLYLFPCISIIALLLSGCQGVGLGNSSSPTLMVTLAGTGQGTVVSNPGGINCGTSCNATFNPGASVTLTATPAAGSSFASWSGACNGAGSCSINLTSNQSVTATFTTGPTFSLTVTLAGTGQGVVTSSPADINCGTTCTANFASGTAVTLTATPSSGSGFAGWGGACSGTAACSLTLSSAQSVTATFSPQTAQAIDHIIFMAQENRGFEHYFGALGLYRLKNGFSTVMSPPGDIDGFTFSSACLAAPDPNSPVCQAQNTNPSAPPDGKTATCPPPNPNPTVQAFHLSTACVENPSPSWEESHIDVVHGGAPNLDWTAFWKSGPPYPMDGFVQTGAGDACADNFNDTLGERVMGYYTDRDLPFYYSTASNFGTSDRWFSPVMSRTQPNRMYLIGATSQGHIYPIQSGSPQLSAKPIFQLLQENNISWKIYVTDPLPGTACPDQNPGSSCVSGSYISQFTYSGNPVVVSHVVSIAQYFTDVANGTLPQVAMIEGGYNSGRDEHPTVTAITMPGQGASIQRGAQFVSTLMNALMKSPSWKDSVFIFTFDEFGGFYDHVPPQPEPNPDGIPPRDFTSVDQQKFNDDFTHSGFRVPLAVISPFSKKNFVSHTVRDYTAILKLIETRFNLPSLNARDAAQDDMMEFFDFVNVPWAVPPTNIPAQPTSEGCGPLP